MRKAKRERVVAREFYLFVEEGNGALVAKATLLGNSGWRSQFLVRPEGLLMPRFLNARD